MGTYNSIQIASMTCPQCHALITDVIVDCRFGFTSQMQELSIGDLYPWTPRRQPQNGGKPVGGNCDGEGYTECPACGRDFFLHVIVRSDRIVAVEPDPTREGYIHS